MYPLGIGENSESEPLIFRSQALFSDALINWKSAPVFFKLLIILLILELKSLPTECFGKQ